MTISTRESELLKTVADLTGEIRHAEYSIEELQSDIDLAKQDIQEALDALEVEYGI